MLVLGELLNLNTARYQLGGAGDYWHSCFSFWWKSRWYRKHLMDTESWDGTSWTEVNNLNTARDEAFGGTGT